MPHHLQVLVEHEGFQAQIDTEIAPLIRDLWRAGIETMNSCQDCDDGGGCVWIEFSTPDDAARFLDIAAGIFEPEAGSLYNRAMRSGNRPDIDGEWLYDVYVDDQNGQLDEDGELTCLGPPQALFSINVRFPRSDLADVTRRVRRHVTRLGEGAAGDAGHGDGGPSSARKATTKERLS